MPLKLTVRIEILTPNGAVTDDLRAYSEYRLFSVIGEHASRIESISVRVGTREMPGAEATCVMVARLSSGGAIRTRCAASHAAAAIDRATARVARSIATRLSDEAEGRVPAPRR